MSLPVPDALKRFAAALLVFTFGIVSILLLILFCAQEHDQTAAFHFGGLVDHSDIRAIFCNGALSYNMYMKYIYPATGIRALKLPSTSPANAAFSLDRLSQSWSVIKEYL